MFIRHSAVPDESDKMVIMVFPR